MVGGGDKMAEMLINMFKEGGGREGGAWTLHIGTTVHEDHMQRDSAPHREVIVVGTYSRNDGSQLPHLAIVASKPSYGFQKSVFL